VKATVPLPAKPLVAVRWQDAQGTATEVINENTVGKWHKPVLVTTIGWLMRQDDEGVSVCCEYCGEGDYRGHTFILAPNLVSIRILRRANPAATSAVVPNGQPSSTAKRSND
jgi:hypothetical protein